MSNREIIDIQINSKDEELQKLQEKLDKLDDKLLKLTKKEYKISNKFLKGFSDGLVKIQTQIQDTEKEIEKLKKQKLDKIFDFPQATAKKTEELILKITKLKNELESLERKRDLNLVKADKTIANVAIISNKIKDLEKDLFLLEGFKDVALITNARDVAERTETIQEKVKSLVKDLDILEKQKKTIQIDEKLSLVKLDEIQDKIKTTENKLNGLESLKEIKLNVSADTTQSLEKLNSEIKTLQEAVTTKTKAADFIGLEKLVKDLEKLEKQKLDLKTDPNDLIFFKQIAEEIRITERELFKLKNMEAKIEINASNIKQLKKVNDDLKKTQELINKLEEERVTIEFQLKNWPERQENIVKLNKQIEKLKENIQKLEQEKLDIKIDPKIIEDSNKIALQITNIQKEIKILEKEKVDLQVVNPEDTKEIIDLDKKLITLREHVKDLSAKENALKIDSDATKTDLLIVQKEIDKTTKVTEDLKKEIENINKVKLPDVTKEWENYTKAVEEAEKKGPSALESSISNLNAMESALSSLSPLVSVLEGIGQAMTGLAASAIEEAKEWEMLRIKLGTFYSSVSEATEEFNYLVEMAKTTPFEIKGLVQSAVMLRAFGNDMRETIQLTGDLAAALGGDVKDASYAVSRALSGASMGFLMLQRTWGISYAKLKALGAEFMSGNKLIAGSIKTQKALLLALQEHHGAMERQSATAAGKLSNLKDAIDTLKESIGQAALPAIKKGVDTATWLVNTIASLPQEIKVAAISIAGLTGGLLLLVSAGYKAVNTLIAVRLAMLNFQASVGGQALIKQITHLALLPVTLTNIKISAIATGTALRAMTTSIAGLALAISPLIVAAAAAAVFAGGAWYFEWKKTQKIMAEVTEETE
ncbi:MAG: hypothetical protein WC309_04240 [Candidatus Paceibacterota bacterium]|jgi:hypothetical protein